jgi:quercetin dioxygenase-like cupin family protein
MRTRRVFKLAAWFVAFGLIAGLGPVIGQQAPPTESKGVKVDKTIAIDLGPEIDGMQGRQLRMLIVTVEPGGVIMLHSHKDRPDAVYVLQGTLTEYRDGGFIKERPEGTLSTAGKDVTHWAENKGTKPLVLIVADIFKQP